MLMTKIIINKKKIIDNYKYYKKKDQITICVVKSNGYGTNIKKIVSILSKNNIDHYAVFTLKEARQIRKINKDCFILLLNSVESTNLKFCIENNITITINSFEDYKMLINYHYQGGVHIKYDTGMHRYGVNKSELYKIVNDNKLFINGIFSHLIGGKEYIKEIKSQIETFDKTLMKIDTRNMLIHITSTNSCDIVKSKYQNAIRIGMGLYGFINHINPAISLRLPICMKKKIQKNECCSYNNSFIAGDDGYIYVIPLGYHNMLLPNTKINVKGFKNAGDICMNCLLLFSKKLYRKKAITLNGYDLLKICKDNSYSIYWLLSSFIS